MVVTTQLSVEFVQQRSYTDLVYKVHAIIKHINKTMCIA